MRLIVNVLRSLTLITTLLLLSGCSFIPFFGEDVKPVEVVTKAQERTKLNLTLPQPLKLQDIKWIVVTPDNIDKVWEQLQKKNTDLVLFGLTDDGYEGLAINMADIRNYINHQRVIIMQYRDYYEPTPEKTVD